MGLVPLLFNFRNVNLHFRIVKYDTKQFGKLEREFLNGVLVFLLWIFIWEKQFVMKYVWIALGLSYYIIIKALYSLNEISSLVRPLIVDQTLKCTEPSIILTPINKPLPKITVLSCGILRYKYLTLLLIVSSLRDIRMLAT